MNSNDNDTTHSASMDPSDPDVTSSGSDNPGSDVGLQNSWEPWRANETSLLNVGPAPTLSAPTTDYPSGWPRSDREPPDDEPGAVAPATPVPTAAPISAAPISAAPTSAERGVRIRTVVFGLVMAAIGALSLVSMLTDVHVDGAIVGLALLIGAGAALISGGIASAVREARGGPGAVH